MRFALHWRIAVAFALLGISLLGAQALYSYKSIRVRTEEYLRTSLLAQARLAAVAMQCAYDQGDGLARLTDELAQAARVRITAIARDGEVLADSQHDASTMENHLNRAEVVQAIAYGWGSAVRHSQTIGVDMLYVAVLAQPDRGEALIVRLALPVTVTAAEIHALRRIVVAGAVVAAALSCLLTIWLARRLTAPIQRMVSVVRRVGRGNLEARMEQQGSGELSELAVVFNRALERLAELVRYADTRGRYYSAVLEQMSDAVVIVDHKIRVQFANPAFERLTGVESGSAEGQLLDVVTANYEFGTLVRRALSEGAVQAGEFALSVPEARTVACAVTPLVGDDGVPGGAVGILHDITDIRSMERELRDFVANGSHELRTPVASIRALAEVLADGALNDPEAAPGFVAHIVEMTERLSAILDDMLALARFDDSAATFGPSWLDARAAFGDALAQVKAAADSKGVELCSEAGDKDGIYADHSALRTLMVNLLDNAVKYTPPGGKVTLTGEAEPTRYVIRVSDTGIGIPERHQPRVFQRFYRVDEGRDRATGGTGLGLAVVKAVAERHGGQVSLRSTVGSGSTFTVSLPYPPDERPPKS